jgi:1-deoxy-D-xylulose-5-phosphate synthase
MQRAYDQVIHDVCLQDLPVVLCLDRAGFAGADGPTHHGAYDLAYLRCVPNLVVSAPMNEEELRNLMFSGSEHNGPYAIRYPRGQGVMPDWRKPLRKIPAGQGRIISEGEDIAILTIGHIGNYALQSKEKFDELGLSVAHYDMRFVKPLDASLLHEVFGKFDKVITVEDGCLMGGFGSAVLEWMVDNGYQARVKRLGIPDEVIEHGEQGELHHECGFDAQGIIQAVKDLMEVTVSDNFKL